MSPSSRGSSNLPYASRTTGSITATSLEASASIQDAMLATSHAAPRLNSQACRHRKDVSMNSAHSSSDRPLT